MTPAELPILSFADDHDFLSNFYVAPIRFEGAEYPTVEHAFQAAKTPEGKERARIRNAPNPGKAKSLGRKVALRKDWEQVKLGVMEALVREKFTAHPDLAARLLATGERQLVEGNTWGDTFWGVVRGNGKNHLGKILMRVRAELQGARKHSTGTP